MNFNRKKSEYSIPVGTNKITFVTNDDDEERPERCVPCRQKFHRFTTPLRTEQNPLPNNPTFCERLKFIFLCPPHGHVGAFLFLVFIFVTWWGVLVAITNTDALPGGNLFSLLVLFFTCWFGGYLITYIRLPPLLGNIRSYDILFYRCSLGNILQRLLYNLIIDNYLN